MQPARHVDERLRTHPPVAAAFYVAPLGSAAAELGVVSRLCALDLKRSLCDSFSMPTALEQVTKEAMDLSPRQKLALAEFLIESADAATDPEAEAAWNSEISDRIRGIDEGRVTGVAYEDMMRAAEGRLVP